MDDLPPPYAPPSPRSTTAAPPQVVLARAPTLPPSYDDATAAQGGQRAQGQPVASPGSPTSASPSSPSSSPSPSYLPTSPSTTTRQPTSRASAETAISPAVRLTPYERQRPLRQVLRRVPWRRSMGAVPATPDDALYRACLLASEVHVQALLDMGTPITYTDRFAATKKAHGSALHGALLGAAPHLAEHLTQVFWGRVYATALEGEAQARAAADAAADAAAAVAVADRETRALLDGRDVQGCTPMHMAAQAGATDAVRRMLRRGAEVDCVDDLGRTPLHMAARYGRDETAALLIGLGATTGHLMPRVSDSADAAGDGSAYDDVDSLWFRARGDRLADLGNYRFVTRFISTIVAKNEKNQKDVKKQNMGLPDDAVPAVQHARDSVPRTPSFVHGSRSRRPSALVADPYALSVPSALAKGKAPGDRWRRTGAAFAVPPEYVAWKDGLDKLQDEHHAQLARNKKAEIPDGYDMLGAGPGRRKE